MPNIAKVLKEEISRVSRKEVKAVAGPMQKHTVQLKRGVAGLKKRLALLERTARQLQDAVAALKGALPAETPPEEAGKARITAKGVRSLRRKLRLSQAEFGRLIGVTNVAVGHWEQREGALKVRQATRTALLGIRGFGAREAQRRLAELSAPAVRAKGRKTGKRK